jgi:hypothetical protein
MSGFSCNYTNDPELGAWNDLYLDANGNIATTNGDAEIVENVYHAIELWLGEYDFNTQLGINWQYYLTTDKPVGNQIKTNLIQAINNVSGVTGITSFNMDLNPINRQLLITVIITLISGNPATISQEF